MRTRVLEFILGRLIQVLLGFLQLLVVNLPSELPQDPQLFLLVRGHPRDEHASVVFVELERLGDGFFLELLDRHSVDAVFIEALKFEKIGVGINSDQPVEEFYHHLGVLFLDHVQDHEKQVHRCPGVVFGDQKVFDESEKPDSDEHEDRKFKGEKGVIFLDFARVEKINRLDDEKKNCEGREQNDGRVALILEEVEEKNERGIEMVQGVKNEPPDKILVRGNQVDE